MPGRWGLCSSSSELQFPTVLFPYRDRALLPRWPLVVLLCLLANPSLSPFFAKLTHSSHNVREYFMWGIHGLTLALSLPHVSTDWHTQCEQSLRKSGGLWVPEEFVSASVLTWLSAHCSAVVQFVSCSCWSATFEPFGRSGCDESILDVNLNLTIFSVLLLYSVRPLDHFSHFSNPVLSCSLC